MKKCLKVIFKEGHNGSLNKVGGQPTHLPSSYPWEEDYNGIYGFLMEIWHGSETFEIENIECIQLWQPLDEGFDPQPFVIMIEKGNILNDKKELLSYPIEPHDICFEEDVEPDELPPTEISAEYGKYFQSKFGGHDPYSTDGNGKYFIGQISEQPLDFNFAGMQLCLYLEKGKIICQLN